MFLIECIEMFFVFIIIKKYIYWILFIKVNKNYFNMNCFYIFMILFIYFNFVYDVWINGID